MTTDTTTALALARNENLDLVATKSGDTNEPAKSGKIGGQLESLAAVIPTGITALYTAFAVSAHTEMVSRCTAERTAFQAEQLGLDNPPSADTIAKKLEQMPLKSSDLIQVRWGIFARAALVATLLAYRAVRKADKKSKKKRPFWRLLFDR